MRFTRYEILVNQAVKIRPAILHTVCHCCGDTIWLELVYQVSNSLDSIYTICRSCASSRTTAYELMNPKYTTVHDILIRNSERVAHHAMQKIVLAQEGLKRIIQVMHEPSSEWNPDRDKVIVGVTVEAENTLRELDRDIRAVQSPARKRTKKREALPENKEQVNVQ